MGILEIICMFAQQPFTALTHVISPKYIMTEIWHRSSVISQRFWRDILMLYRIALPCHCHPEGYLKMLSSHLQTWREETEALWPTLAAADHLLIPNGVSFKISNPKQLLETNVLLYSLNIFTSDGLAFLTHAQIWLCECIFPDPVFKLSNLEVMEHFPFHKMFFSREVKFNHKSLIILKSAVYYS